MSNHVGISCIKISGYGRTNDQAIGQGSVNHMWNAVRLNAKWYLCDATWASSGLDPATLKFNRRFDKNYFLTDPSLFIANHYPKDTTLILLYNKPTLKEYLNSPMKYSAYISNQVNQYFPIEGIVRTKKDSIATFGFTSNVDLKEKSAKVCLLISGKKSESEIRKKMPKNTNGFYSTTHTFEKTGNYTVHVLINGHDILTYKVYAK